MLSVFFCVGCQVHQHQYLLSSFQVKYIGPKRFFYLDLGQNPYTYRPYYFIFISKFKIADLCKCGYGSLFQISNLESVLNRVVRIGVVEWRGNEQSPILGRGLFLKNPNVIAFTQCVALEKLPCILLLHREQKVQDTLRTVPENPWRKMINKFQC